MSRSIDRRAARRRPAVVPAVLAALAMPAALAGLPAAAAPPPPAPPPPIRIVGYNDMDEMFAALTARYAARHPGARFELVLKSTRSAPAALIDGSSTLAPMGAEMTAADLAGFCARYRRPPALIAVAHDSLVPGTLSSPTGILVQAGAPLAAIGLAQLRAVFVRAGGGRWGDLGATGAAAARPLHPVALGAGTAIGGFVLGRLGATAYAAGVRQLPQSREVAAAVAADPDAIGIANLNHAGPGLRALDLVDARGRIAHPRRADIVAGRYPLDRRLLVYARIGADGRVEPAARRFLAFMLSREGQKLIAAGAKGYLPLGPAERGAENRRLQSLTYPARAGVRHLSDGPSQPQCPSTGPNDDG